MLNIIKQLLFIYSLFLAISTAVGGTNTVSIKASLSPLNVLTIGFDHPELDCIILLKPTRSICRYVQLLGRGVRIAPGKTSCKVIDLTSTVKNLGRFETIKVEKINGKSELTSEMGSWHNKILYKYEIKTKDKRKDISFFVNRNKRK